MNFNINEYIRTREGTTSQWPVDPDTRKRIERLTAVEVDVYDSTRRRGERRSLVMLIVALFLLLSACYGIVWLIVSEMQ